MNGDHELRGVNLQASQIGEIATMSIPEDTYSEENDGSKSISEVNDALEPAELAFTSLRSNDGDCKTETATPVPEVRHENELVPRSQVAPTSGQIGFPLSSVETRELNINGEQPPQMPRSATTEGMEETENEVCGLQSLFSSLFSCCICVDDSSFFD